MSDKVTEEQINEALDVLMAGFEQGHPLLNDVQLVIGKPSEVTE